MDPKIHSPRNSGNPTLSRRLAAMPAATAMPMRIAARLSSSAMSPISAFPSSTWAPISRLAEFRVAPICWRRPGASGGCGGCGAPRAGSAEPAGDPAAADPPPDAAVASAGGVGELSPMASVAASRGDSPDSGGRLSAPDPVGCVSSSGWAPVRGGLGRAR